MRQVASPVPVENVRGADVTIMGNRFLEIQYGAEIVDVENVRYVFAGNRVDSTVVGVTTYDNCLGGSSVCGFHASNVTIAGNAIRSLDGLELFNSSSPDTKGTVVGNDIDYDAENGGVAVWLARKSSGWFVVTDGAVLDRGTNNRVIILP